MLKTKLVITLIIIIVIMAGTISGLGYWVKLEIANGNRHEQNYKNEQSGFKRFKTETGEEAVRVGEQQLTSREVKRSDDSTINALYLEAKNLGNEKRHLEQLLNVKTETRIDSVVIPIYDTTIIRIEDTIKRIASVNTTWLDATIAVFLDRLEVMDYISRDDITIILKWYKEKKFFLFRWFEKKKYAADIISKNPNSKITQAENIKVTTKRGR